jgi:hypothetical protein
VSDGGVVSRSVGVTWSGVMMAMKVIILLEKNKFNRYQDKCLLNNYFSAFTHIIFVVFIFKT